MDTKLIGFVDDDKNRHEKFAKVYPDSLRSWNAADCIQAMKDHKFSVFYLDHDLEDICFDNPAKENSGSGIVRWVVKNNPSVDKFIVHSYNFKVAPTMVKALKAAGYDAEEKPFDF